ncbi:MAG: spore germination protein [Clostridia bacterium]|nr:spore germination protein [Clostridia bacterium]
MKLSSSLTENLKELKKAMPSSDIRFTKVELGKTRGVLIFSEAVTDKKSLGDLIVKPLKELKSVSEETLLSSALSPDKKTLDGLTEIEEEIASGNTVLIADGIKKAFSFGLKKYEQRAITEPPTSTVIKGPREGFVESVPVNISLMRRRIKSPDLTFTSVTVGDLSKTPVVLCYLKSVADPTLVETVKDKLSNIKMDAVLDSSYVSKRLSGESESLFKKVGNTEKPDILAAKILEGRVAVFVDGSPIALTVPYLLIEDFQSPSDYYGSPYSATFSRVLRLISVFISVLLPALFVSAELFHLQLIPLAFLLTIENSIKGIPLSPSYEMFFTLLIFEILNEASVRMPRYVGMVVSIVGALVLGETAVNAGIISAPTLMIVALSGICLYTVPELEQTLSFVRLVFLIVAGSIGCYGLLVAVGVLTVYLITFESYGAPVCAPYSPLVKKDLRDGFVKRSGDGTSRPLSIAKAKLFGGRK